MAFYGDSIATGALASPNGQLSYFAKIRSIYPGRISGCMWGGRSLWDDTTSGGAQIGFKNVNLLAAHLVALVQLGGATTTREIVDFIGTNDATYGGVGRQSAVNFGVMLGQLYDAIHTLDPSIHIWAISPLITTQETHANSFGDMPPAYRTAKQTACSGRSWVTYQDGLALMAVGGLSGDGLHPTNNGHSSIADGTGGFAGTTNLRNVFNI